MLAVALVAAAYFLSHRFGFGEDLSQQANPSIVQNRLPPLIQDDINEKSFAANQRHHTIRNPFGPNPDTHYVNSFELINYPQYRTRYTGNLHNLTVRNQDWRLDPSFSTCLNNYTKVHMPEDYPTIIPNQTGNSRTPAPQFDNKR